MTEQRPTKERVEKLDKNTIHDAATSAIVAFAAKEAGLAFNEGASREYMITEIFEALEWEAYKPEVDATHVIINMPKTKENAGTPYRGGFNGKMFSVKRGEDVEMPIGYYNTIIDAASNAFTISAIRGSNANLSEGGTAHKRIPYGSIDLSVKKFINKG
jgi:hypothetical protein